MDEKIEQAAQILANARHVIALTGAGISTPSGIPDFRSFESGLWQSVDPYQVATIHAFRQDPQAFYDWVRPFVNTVLNAEPNPAHFALTRLGQMGILKGIITQNIDGLHQRADSTVVYEVHGHLRQATCIRCYATVPGEPVVRAFAANGRVPRCQECHGVIKPNIILYGEQLPVGAMIAARQAAIKSDVMLVVGSSLEVAPAGDLPILTQRRDGRLIFFNLGPTYLDEIADIVVRADVAEALPSLLQAVRSKLKQHDNVIGFQR